MYRNDWSTLIMFFYSKNVALWDISDAGAQQKKKSLKNVS